MLQVTVRGLTPGQQISAVLRSDPIIVTGIPAANANGVVTFTVPIPSDLSIGMHSLTISAAGQADIVVPVKIVAAGTLAVTGSQLPLGILLAGSFALAAGWVLMVTRRRREV